ncbi:hypothetical protein PL79_023945 [Burkholderia sp. USMB20]|nr:hypothetical protein PL79_023945 [Burkholderia sp. USMB20]
MAGDRNGLQVDDARRVVGRRGSDGVHGGGGKRVGDAVRQNLCCARREVRSFDNRRARCASPACRQQPERMGATRSMPVSRQAGARAQARFDRSRNRAPAAAQKRECRPIANHGTGQRWSASLGRQEIRVAIISRRMTCDAV